MSTTISPAPFNVDYCPYPLAFDPLRKQIYGYWQCQQCNNSFYFDSSLSHKQQCSLKGRVLIYKFGPNECGWEWSPISSDKTKQTIQLAKKAVGGNNDI